MVVLNAEMRVPLVGLFNPRRMYGGVSIELAVFPDAGLAWTSGARPSLVDGDREWVCSVGAALRFNAFGFCVTLPGTTVRKWRPGGDTPRPRLSRAPVERWRTSDRAVMRRIC